MQAKNLFHTTHNWKRMMGKGTCVFSALFCRLTSMIRFAFSFFFLSESAEAVENRFHQTFSRLKQINTNLCWCHIWNLGKSSGECATFFWFRRDMDTFCDRKQWDISKLTVVESRLWKDVQPVVLLIRRENNICRRGKLKPCPQTLPPLGDTSLFLFNLA